jgi:hypothetical protein
MTEKTNKITFAPGCFDNFDGTQDELDELIAQIKKMVEDGTLEENATPLTPEEEELMFQKMNQRKERQ